jgi:Suppressor of fused protein (SUFU)
MTSKIDNYKKEFKADDWPGLAAINLRQKERYGDQQPTHWATVVPFELGGEDPLWAIESFVNDKQQRHIHYMTLGFTNLWYDEECAEDEINGFGFELTFRCIPLPDDKGPVPIWPANFLQNIAKYVFESKKGFDDFHYMSANGPLRSGTDTEITAFAFYIDSEMGEIETPHGRVKFLQIFGITTDEYSSIREKKYTARELIEKHRIQNPLLITDLNRK